MPATCQTSGDAWPMLFHSNKSDVITLPFFKLEIQRQLEKFVRMRPQALACYLVPTNFIFIVHVAHMIIKYLNSL